MDAKTRRLLEQGPENWQIAVDLANTWRRMLNVEPVNYPYPGDFRVKSQIKP